MKFASLYLVCSEKEEYSISLIEAMSLGIPFVSTNVGNAKMLPGGITVNLKTELSHGIDRVLGDDTYIINYHKRGVSMRMLIAENLLR